MSYIRPAFMMLLLMAILTGIIYPLMITGIAQIILPEKANGSLLKQGEKVMGSKLIAQNFKNDRYFWPRPSAIDYDPIKPSGGSNYGPTSQKLKEIVQGRVSTINKGQPLDSATIPSDLVYASASGLDPHISLRAAYYQIDRIAKARALTDEKRQQLETLVDQMTEGRQLGFLGSQYVNVFLLNLALDSHFRAR